MRKDYLNKLSILFHILVLFILFFEAFKVVPPTEGWFTALTKDKNLGQIIINDEILLTPIYPLFIWLVSKLSYQIIFLRFIGIIFGLCLYFESAKLIKKGTLLINSFEISAPSKFEYPCFFNSIPTKPLPQPAS